MCHFISDPNRPMNRRILVFHTQPTQHGCPTFSCRHNTYNKTIGIRHPPCIHSTRIAFFLHFVFLKYGSVLLYGSFSRRMQHYVDSLFKPIYNTHSFRIGIPSTRNWKGNIYELLVPYYFRVVDVIIDVIIITTSPPPPPPAIRSHTTPHPVCSAS